jgi:hypothetical protein
MADPNCSEYRTEIITEYLTLLASLACASPMGEIESAYGAFQGKPFFIGDLHGRNDRAELGDAGHHPA